MLLVLLVVVVMVVVVVAAGRNVWLPTALESTGIICKRNVMPRYQNKGKESAHSHSAFLPA